MSWKNILTTIRNAVTFSALALIVLFLASPDLWERFHGVGENIPLINYNPMINAILISSTALMGLTGIIIYNMVFSKRATGDIKSFNTLKLFVVFTFFIGISTIISCSFWYMRGEFSSIVGSVFLFMAQLTAFLLSNIYLLFGYSGFFRK